MRAVDVKWDFAERGPLRDSLGRRFRFYVGSSLELRVALFNDGALFDANGDSITLEIFNEGKVSAVISEVLVAGALTLTDWLAGTSEHVKFLLTFEQMEAVRAGTLKIRLSGPDGSVQGEAFCYDPFMRGSKLPLRFPGDAQIGDVLHDWDADDWTQGGTEEWVDQKNGLILVPSSPSNVPTKTANWNSSGKAAIDTTAGIAYYFTPKSGEVWPTGLFRGSGTDEATLIIVTEPPASFSGTLLDIDSDPAGSTLTITSDAELRVTRQGSFSDFDWTVNGRSQGDPVIFAIRFYTNGDIKVWAGGQMWTDSGITVLSADVDDVQALLGYNLVTARLLIYNTALSDSDLITYMESLSDIYGVAVYDSPVAPTGLTITAVSTTSYKLDWTDNADITDSLTYKIERSTDGVSYSEIAETANGAETYTDTTASVGQRYYYKIRAYNDAIDEHSAYSSVVNNIPAAPTSFVATANGTTQIDLTWANVAGEDNYDLDISTDGGSNYTDEATPAADVVAYSDTGLTESTTYHYRLRVSVNSVWSDYSTANATTEDPIVLVRFTGDDFDDSAKDWDSTDAAYTLATDTGTGSTDPAKQSNWNSSGKAAVDMNDRDLSGTVPSTLYADDRTIIMVLEAPGSGSALKQFEYRNATTTTVRAGITVWPDSFNQGLHRVFRAVESTYTQKDDNRSLSSPFIIGIRFPASSTSIKFRVNDDEYTGFLAGNASTALNELVFGATGSTIADWELLSVNMSDADFNDRFEARAAEYNITVSEL